MEEQDFIESRDQMEKLLREEGIGYLGLSVDDNLENIMTRHVISAARTSVFWTWCAN
jgi:hypothetical protein